MKTSGRLELLKGDITKQNVDAIVNAANTTLLGGGGVDGAIHNAAGRQLLEECRSLNGCDTGDAKKTLGYNLPAKYVIHTVGPVWHGGDNNEQELLASCYKKSLQIAKDLKLHTITFPCISTGIYGFPKVEAAKIAISVAKDFLSKNKLPVIIKFVVFDDESYRIYKELIDLV